jgi:hypothetical protein
MSHRAALWTLILIPILGLAGCAPQATKRGEPGRWAVTKYLVRIYQTDLKTAHEAGKRYFEQKGYAIDQNSLEERKSILHGFLRPAEGTQKSLILRTKYLSPEFTHVEIKAGPSYNRDETIAMMDEYQKLLPEPAQPK